MARDRDSLAGGRPPRIRRSAASHRRLDPAVVTTQRLLLLQTLTQQRESAASFVRAWRANLAQALDRESASTSYLVAPIASRTACSIRPKSVASRAPARGVTIQDASAAMI